jgi:hypothetical protein
LTGKNPLLAWLLGWLLPGAGHWYLGQRSRGIVLAGALTGCFGAGVLLGGGGTVSRAHPEFLVLQWGAGLPAAAAWAGGSAEPADLPVSRRELGVLYTLVPALLNLVVALDAAARAAGADPGGPTGPRRAPAPTPPPPPPAAAAPPPGAGEGAA